MGPKSRKDQSANGLYPVDGVHDWDNMAVDSLPWCLFTMIEGLLHCTRYQDRGRQQEIYDIVSMPFMPIFQAAEAVHLPMHP